jgi:hypothetical protein
MDNPVAVILFETIMRKWAEMSFLDNYIETKLKDGTIDAVDMPELLVILMGMIDRLPKLDVSEKDMHDVMVLFFEYIIQKNDFLKTNEVSQAEFARVYYNCVQLALMKKRIKSVQCACVIS